MFKEYLRISIAVIEKWRIGTNNALEEIFITQRTGKNKNRGLQRIG